MIKIREMTIEDYNAVSKLWQRSEGIGLSNADSPENIRKFLQRNPGLSFTAKKGNEIVATVLCGHDGRRGYLYHLFVAKEYRKMGIGKALVKKCLNRLREEGIDKCHLFVFAENKNGQNFWANIEWDKREDIHVYSKNTYL